MVVHFWLPLLVVVVTHPHQEQLQPLFFFVLILISIEVYQAQLKPIVVDLPLIQEKFLS